jgi:hypothetical protein
VTVNHYPNSLVNRVSEAVIRRGTATLDDLQQDFPEVGRKQLHDALSNARDRKRLRIKAKGSARASRLSIWEPEPEPMPKPAQKEPLRPIPSVWSLGEMAEWTGAWPPLPAGRLVDQLGPWDAP